MCVLFLLIYVKSDLITWIREQLLTFKDNNPPFFITEFLSEPLNFTEILTSGPQSVLKLIQRTVLRIAWVPYV